jgi:hypothetical protein
MKKIAIAMLLLSTPVMAQQGTYVPPPQTGGGIPAPQTGGVAPPAPESDIVQRCYPIGKTVSGELVFSMDCKFPVAVTLPAGRITQTVNPDGSVSVTYPTGHLPPSQTSGAPPSGFSNVTPGVTNGNTPPVTNGNMK